MRKGNLSMREFLNKMKSCFDMLASIGAKVADKDQILHIILALGTEYDPVMITVTSRMDTWSVMDVQALLLSYESRLESTGAINLNNGSGNINQDGSQPSLNLAQNPSRAVLDKRESSSSAPDDVGHDVSGPIDVPESYKLARDRVRRTNIQAPIGYKRCDVDCCVYTKSLGDGSMIFLLLYVDDMLIAAKNMRDIIDLKSLLSQEFEMKDLGAAKKILGMEIHRDRGSNKLWLSHKGYVEKVLQRFGMNEAKPVSTPLANHFKLSVDQCPKSDKETQDMVEVPYASAVGCLMYAMVCTRPDLAHAVGQVCKYMSRPGKQHWEAVKWIFRYLKGTAGYGIVFGDQRLDPLVVGYVDSDYAGDLDNRRSTTGARHEEMGTVELHRVYSVLDERRWQHQRGGALGICLSEEKLQSMIGKWKD
ncbi:Uncharacterized mitochondrial protein AtMg00810 [Striga hermonthica]|uniref:Uncharacterized mitochondrial protein AtMg00810 n=1 Tax=Striga hermonthica TaxID=68872 RepID=A0A9N7RC77_STRHE|nr:Uncharacterized mitochondrial protein AtMg00810 [Striga hermonthica]